MSNIVEKERKSARERERDRGREGERKRGRERERHRERERERGTWVRSTDMRAVLILRLGFRVSVSRSGFGVQGSGSRC